MSTRCPEYQIPNPLDLLLFAFERAETRLSLPGAILHMHLELAGRIDVPAFRQALACLHRRFPVTQSRLESSPVLGRPRWRLHTPPADLARVVELHELSPPTPAELERRVNLLLNQRGDATRLPPLQFHVLRGLPAGDLVVVRWPHAMMDARGTIILMDHLDRLYREKADPAAISSEGDESLTGFEGCRGDSPKSVPARRRRTRNGASDRVRDAGLPPCPPLREVGPLRAVVRHLDENDCGTMAQILSRLCPSVRLGAFVRACAVRSLHRLVARPSRQRCQYSVPYMLEGRPPPCRKPVCRNLFSIDRVSIPSEIAADRAAVARMLHDGTNAMVDRGFRTSHLTTLIRITRLPTAVLTDMVRRSLISEPYPWERIAIPERPSLPMGFVQAFGRDKRSFCGADLRYVHMFRPALPPPGIGIQIVAEQGRLAICGLCFEAREKMLRQFLDDFIAGLLDID